MEHPPAALSAHDLECIRDDRVLFSGLSFDVKAGRVLQIEGRNGSGKTSLLRILCGLSLPAEGEVRWRGVDIQEEPAPYRAQLNYIGHAAGLKGDLTPLENLKVSQSLSREPLAIELDEALRQVGLRGFEDVPVRTLSAGQQRRAALARLLIRRTLVWILDEPFTALDKKGTKQVEQFLDEHASQGGIAVLTSHHHVECRHAEILQLDAL